VVIVIPPVEEHERMIRAGAPSWSEERVRGFASLSDADFEFGSELIQHRMVFESMDVLRLVDGSDVQAPEDGYVAWFVFEGRLRIYMKLDGQAELTPLKLDRMNSFDYVERHRYILETIEEFVRESAPHT
jgi:hypothetical protein